MSSQDIARLSSGVFFAAALGAAGMAMGATAELVSVSGTAMVSEGARYVEGQETKQLAVGDRVFGLEGSHVVLQYQDGCSYTLKEGEVFTIADKSPCAGAASSTSDALPAASADTGGVDPNWVAVGFIGTALVAGAALDTGGDSSRRPISP